MSAARKACCVCLAFAAALLASAGARAQDTGLSRAAAGLRDAVRSATAECEAGALVVRVTTELAAGAPDARGLVIGVLAPTVEALRADERFDSVHVASFGGAAAGPATLAHRLGYTVLVDLVVRVDRGVLVLEGAAWSARGEMEHATFAHREPLDVALRQHVGFPAVLADDAVTARSVRIPGRDYVALAVHDIDQDGRFEIVAARVDEVHVFRLEGRHARLVGRARYPDIARAVAPRRRLVGSAIGIERQVVVRISDLDAPIAVTLEGGVLTAQTTEGPCGLDRYPMVGGCAELVDGRDFFDDVLAPHEAPYATAPAHFYTYVFAQFPTRAGETVQYEALITPAGRLALRARWQRIGEVVSERTSGASGYGTALAMSDLDLDGSAEILLSHASAAGAGDQLSLVRAVPRGGVRVMWRSEVLPGSVWLAAAGDVDADGQPELVAIEEPADGRGRARLWIVR